MLIGTRSHGGYVLALALFLSGSLAGCRSLSFQARRDAQIRARVADIRMAILERRAEGIIAWATPDWTFIDPDGVVFDRGQFMSRTRALFDRLVGIESLSTEVDSIRTRPGFAEVEITQTMVRRERAPDGGELRVRQRYRERQEWVLAPDGWRVRGVTFLGQPERTLLPTQ